MTLGDAVHAAGGWARRGAETMLRRLERAIPETSSIRAFVEAQRPDVMLLTPLIDLGSSQIDYLRAARALGIPTALCVWSWDHLSSKALIRECPDRVFVWNETQKREAIELHRVPSDRVVVTGAQCFDHWFDRAPSRSRDDFCNQVGLDTTRPFVLWVCSALIHGSAPEAPFVVEWIRRLRASDDPVFRDVGVLVRPHPSRVAEWESIDIRPLNAVVWGSNPIDEHARADYFDSIFHSAAVVGLNTSAFIEAGIVGRPVLTIVVPEFVENQHGTVHFDYLVHGRRRPRHGGRWVRRAFRATGESDDHAGRRTQAIRARLRQTASDWIARPRRFSSTRSKQCGICLVEPLRADALAPRLALDASTRCRAEGQRRFERWTLSPREQVTAERAALHARAEGDSTSAEPGGERCATAANANCRSAKRDSRLYRQQRQEARSVPLTNGRLPAIQASERAR